MQPSEFLKKIAALTRMAWAFSGRLLISRPAEHAPDFEERNLR
jgi:hypothetical protein